MDFLNAMELYKKYDSDMEAEEADRGWCAPDEWSLDLGKGVSVRRMNSRTHPFERGLGAGNFFFTIDGHEFAYIGMSMVHDQMYLTVPQGGETSPEWHQTCNELLAANGVPFVLLYPVNMTVSFNGEHEGKEPRLPLMRDFCTFVEQKEAFDTVQRGTTFGSKMHGTPWTRFEPDSDMDYHIMFCFGLNH